MNARTAKNTDLVKLRECSTNRVFSARMLAEHLATQRQTSVECALTVVRCMVSQMSARQTRRLFGVRYERMSERKASTTISFEDRLEMLEGRVFALESRDSDDFEGRGSHPRE